MSATTGQGRYARYVTMALPLVAALVGWGCRQGASPDPPSPTPAATGDAGIPDPAAAAGGSSPSTPTAISDGGAPGAEPATPRKPDHVRVYIEAEPAGLLPDLEGDVWGRRIAMGTLYEPLVRALPEGGFEPALADHWTVDDGGRRYLFFLRETARFHDGRPLTSTDVVYSIDRVRSSAYARARSPRLPSALADVERVELAGRAAVRLELRRPMPRLLEILSEIAIVPDRAYDKGDPARPALGHRPVGTGPFRLDDWGRRRIVLARFDDYWGERPPASRIEVVIEPDAARALFQAKRGEADVVGHLPPTYVPDQLETPAIGSRHVTVRVHAPRFAFVLWNLAHPPLDDAAVRRALSQVVDRRRILDEARHGLGRPLRTVPAGEGPLPGKLDPREVQAAYAALDAAGLARGPGGVRARAGKPVRFILLTPSGSREAEAAGRQVSEAIGRAGIPVDVVATDMGTLVSRLRRGAFDGAVLEWNGVDDDDLEPVLGSEGAWALGGFRSKPMDQLLDALRVLPAGEERRRTRAQLAREVEEQQPLLLLYGADETYLYARRLRPPVIVGDFFRLRDVGPR